MANGNVTSRTAAVLLMKDGADGVADTGVVTSGVFNGQNLQPCYIPSAAQILPAGSVPLTALAQGGAVSTNVLAWNGTAWAPSVAAAGTVTSVGLTVPAIFSVAGSPVTASGTLAVTLATQTANTVWAGPTTGGAVAPTFRALVAADIPGTLSVSLANGLVNTPSLFFASSPTTGIYRSAADALSFTAAGVISGTISAAGNWTVGNATNWLQVGGGTADGAGSLYLGTQGNASSVQITKYGAGGSARLMTGNGASNAPWFASAYWVGGASNLGMTNNGTNLSLLSTTGVQFGTATVMASAADGTLQVTTSAGAFGTILLGAAGAATGVQISASNVVFQLRDGAAGDTVQLKTARVTASNNLTGNLVGGNGFGLQLGSSTTGIYFAQISTSTRAYQLQDSNAGTTPGYLLKGTFSVAKTANYTLAFADMDTHFTNVGAAGSVTFTLPTAQQGLAYHFTCTAAQNLVVTAGSTILNGSGASNTGKTSITAAGATTGRYTNFSVVCYDGTNWAVRGLDGVVTYA